MGGPVLALIPARGGSKGLVGKNLRLLGGHPLVAWAIAAARMVPSIDRIICSTDSPDIAEVARQYGAETPFLRPAELAGDLSTDLEAFHHALDWLRDHDGWKPETLVQLRPTSPFREHDLVETALSRLAADPALSSVRGVTPSEHTPYKTYSITGSGLLEPLFVLPQLPEAINMPRQLLPPSWRATGQIDVIRTTVVRDQASMTGPRIGAIETAGDTAVDIDTTLDLAFAEFLLTTLRDRIVLPDASCRSTIK